jgi:DMSO reductase family type II enzyme chaperone
MTTTMLEHDAPAPPRRPHKGQRANCRAILYSFFAQALSLPSPELIRGQCDGSLRAAIDDAVRGAPAAHRALLERAAIADLARSDGEPAARDALLVEYTRLWGSDLVCPHYETDYVRGDSFRAVHVIADVAAFYSTFGVRVAADQRERPDHIAVELEFMNFLATKQAYALSQGEAGPARLCRQAQSKFFADHLGQWAARFAETLLAAAHDPFHRTVARLLLAFATAEAGYLEVSADGNGNSNGDERPAAAPARVRRLNVIA